MSTFIEAIQAAGYSPPNDIIWDGALHRFASDCQRKYSKDAWYVAFDDAKGKAGCFGSWRDGRRETWTNGTGRKVSEQEHRYIEEQERAKKEELVKKRTQAALRAKRNYDAAQPASADTPYLQRKGISVPEGIRYISDIPFASFGFSKQGNFTGMLCPLYNAKGILRSLQLINDDPREIKLFMKDADKQGCFHVLGGDLDSACIIVLAEGLATAQSVHQATGYCVVMCADAGNIPIVAARIHKRNPTADFVIAADDDEAGRKAADTVIRQFRASVFYPGSGYNDFNDLHVGAGIDAVRQVFIPAEAIDNEDWRADLITRTKDGGETVIQCRTHNLILILDHAKEFKGRIRLNEMSSQIAIDGVDMDETAPVNIKAQMEKSWINDKISTNEVIEALGVVSKKSPFHPVREYLNSLTWDGVERIPHFFSDHFGCQRDEYHIAVALSLFLSAVARIYKPGAKVDTMVILQSAQGRGKTKLWLALFGKWCVEVTSNLNDKDFFSGLRGVWCADFGELDQFSKAEHTRIKQVITQTDDHYRPHYGRQHQKYPRQCIFVGGTNKDDWNTDPTGARRFLPVRVDQDIDVIAIEAVRDQLFAEAVERFNRGETWWHIPFASDHQEASYVGDTWESYISKWLDKQYHGSDYAVTTSEILEHALHIESGRHTRSDQTRVGNVLGRMGWQVKQLRRFGIRVRVYAPSDKWIAEWKEARLISP